MSEEQVKPAQQAEEKPAIDPKAIAAAVAEAMPKPEKKMTDDELRAYLQVWEPDEQFADAFRTTMLDEEATAADRKKAFVAMRDGITTQAVRGAELLLEEKLAEIDKRYGGAAQYAEQAQAEQLWSGLVGKYPTLKEHKDLVEMVSSNLVTSGFKPKNVDELFDKVAEGTAGLIKRFDQSFSIGEKGQQQQKMPEMVGNGVAPQAGPGAPQVASDADVASIWD